MKKIVFFSIPAHGHTNPTIPVVTELVKEGHKVWYYSFNEFKEKIESELKIGFNTKPVVADTEEELEDVFVAPSGSSARGEPITQPRLIDNSAINSEFQLSGLSDGKSPLWGVGGLRLIDSIKQGLHQSMKVHPNLILMGQDIAEYGGAFKITE